MTSVKNSGGPAQVLWGNPANRELFQGKVVFWSNWNTREVFPFALTPLTWSHFIQLVGPGFLESLWGITQRSSLYPYSAIVDLIYGRLYWNMNLTYGHPLWSPLFRRLVSQLDAEAGRVFTQLCELSLIHI